MEALPSSCFRSRKGAARKNNKCKIAASELRECEVEVPLENVPRICSSGTLGNKVSVYETANSAQHGEKETIQSSIRRSKAGKYKVDSDRPEEETYRDSHGPDVHQKDERLDVLAPNTTSTGGSVSYRHNVESSVCSAAANNDDKLGDKLDIYPNVEQVVEQYSTDEQPVPFSKLDDIYNIEQVGDFDVYPKSKHHSSLEFTNLANRAKSDKDVPEIEDVMSLDSKESSVQKRKYSSGSSSSRHKETQKQGSLINMTIEGPVTLPDKGGEAEVSSQGQSVPGTKSPLGKSPPKTRSVSESQDAVSPESTTQSATSFSSTINEKRGRDEAKSSSRTKQAKRKKRGNNWYKSKNKHRPEQEELVGWTRQTNKPVLYEHDPMDERVEREQSVSSGATGSKVRPPRYSSLTKTGYDCGGYIQIKYDDELNKYTEGRGMQPEGSFGSTIRHSSMEEVPVGNEEPTITDVFRQNFHLYNDRELINDFNSKYFLENYCLQYNPVTFLTERPNMSDYRGEFTGMDSSNDDSHDCSSSSDHTDNQYSSSSYDQESGPHDSESNERMDSDPGASSNGGMYAQHGYSSEFGQGRYQSGHEYGGHPESQSRWQTGSRGYVVSNKKVHDLLTRYAGKLEETPEMSTESLSRVLMIPEMYLETAEHVDIEDLETLRHMEIDLLKSYKKVLSKARMLLNKDSELKKKYSRQISEAERMGKAPSKMKFLDPNIETVDLVTFVLSIANLKKRRKKTRLSNKRLRSRRGKRIKHKGRAQYMGRIGIGLREAVAPGVGSSAESALVIGSRHDHGMEGAPGMNREYLGRPEMMKQYDYTNNKIWLYNEYDMMEKQDIMNFIRDMDETTNTTSSSESLDYSSTLIMSNGHSEEKKASQSREKEEPYRDVLLGDFKNFFYEEQRRENKGEDLKQEDLSQMIESMSEEQQHTAIETVLDAQHGPVTETIVDDPQHDGPSRETMVDLQNETAMEALDDSQDPVLEALEDSQQDEAMERMGYIQQASATDSLDDSNQELVIESLEDYQQDPIIETLNDSHNDLVIENMGYFQLDPDVEGMGDSQNDTVPDAVTDSQQDRAIENIPDSQEVVYSQQDPVMEETPYSQNGTVMESLDDSNREVAMEETPYSQPDQTVESLDDSHRDVPIVDSQQDLPMVDSQSEPVIESIVDMQQEAVDLQQEMAEQQSPEARKEERSRMDRDETAKSVLYKRRFNKEFKIKKSQKQKNSISLIKSFNVNSKNQVSTPVASSLASSVNASSLLSNSLNNGLSVGNNGTAAANNLGAVSTSVPITLGSSTVNVTGLSISSPKLANFGTTGVGAGSMMAASAGLGNPLNVSSGSSVMASSNMDRREEDEEDMMNISTPKNKKFANVNLKCLEIIRSNSDKLVRTINCTFINKRSKNHMPSSLNKDKDNKRNILLNPTNCVNREDEGRVLMERSKRKRSIGDNWVSEMWNDNINVITCKKMKLGHGSFSTVSLAILRIIQPYAPNHESTALSNGVKRPGNARSGSDKRSVELGTSGDGGSNTRIVDVTSSVSADGTTAASNTVANASTSTANTTTSNTGATANSDFNCAEDSSNSESDMMSTVVVNRNPEAETRDGDKKRLLYECAIKNISDNYGELSRYQYIREKEMMLHYNQHVLKPISYRILYSPNNEKIYQLLLPRAKGDLLTMLNKLIIYRTNLMYNLLYASTASGKVNGKEAVDNVSRVVKSPIYSNARHVVNSVDGINARGVKGSVDGVSSGVGKGVKYSSEGTRVSKRVKAIMDSGNMGIIRGSKGGNMDNGNCVNRGVIESGDKSGKVLLEGSMKNDKSTSHGHEASGNNGKSTAEGSPDKDINLDEFVKRAMDGTNRLYGLFEVEIKYLLIQIISGLAFIHMCFQGNILRHTDIKLTNILVFCEEEDRHKPLKWHLNLADFGCSALIKPNQYFNQIQHLYSTLNGLTSGYAYRSSAAKETVYREGLYMERNREESSWEKYMKEWHDQLHHQLLSYNIGTLRYNSPESLLYDQYLNRRMNNNSQLLNILYHDVVRSPAGIDVARAEESSEVSSCSHRAQKEMETRSYTESVNRWERNGLRSPVTRQFGLPLEPRSPTTQYGRMRALRSPYYRHSNSQEDNASQSSRHASQSDAVRSPQVSSSVEHRATGYYQDGQSVLTPKAGLALLEPKVGHQTGSTQRQLGSAQRRPVLGSSQQRQGSAEKNQEPVQPTTAQQSTPTNEQQQPPTSPLEPGTLLTEAQSALPEETLVEKQVEESDMNLPMKETTLDGIKYIRVDSKSDMWSLGIILSELIKYSIKDDGKVMDELSSNNKLDTFSTYINSLSLSVDLGEKMMRNRSKEIKNRLYNRLGNGVFYNRLSSHLNTRKKSKKQFLNNPNYMNKDNFGNKDKYSKDKEQVDKENRLLSIYINNVCNNTFEVRKKKMRELYGAGELEGVSEELFDLLVNLLAYDPEERMHSIEALGHPFFDDSEEVFELVDATNSCFVNKLLSVYTLNTSTKMLAASKGSLSTVNRSSSSNAATPSMGSRVEAGSGAGINGNADYDEELYNDGELDSYSWYKGPLYYYFSTYDDAAPNTTDSKGGVAAVAGAVDVPEYKSVEKSGNDDAGNKVELDVTTNRTTDTTARISDPSVSQRSECVNTERCPRATDGYVADSADNTVANTNDLPIVTINGVYNSNGNNDDNKTPKSKSFIVGTSARNDTDPNNGCLYRLDSVNNMYNLIDIPSPSINLSNFEMAAADFYNGRYNAAVGLNDSNTNISMDVDRKGGDNVKIGNVKSNVNTNNNEPNNGDDLNNSNDCDSTVSKSVDDTSSHESVAENCDLKTTNTHNSHTQKFDSQAYVNNIKVNKSKFNIYKLEFDIFQKRQKELFEDDSFLFKLLDNIKNN
ncbi:non-specific serine/threonine protein kinase [Theileria orientalis]|uniref:Non-specific serine/threonine protein kinase n=1 Tax=Theileria orientalis TaxID=68886 RepID=A0A976QRT7_THEOR|nr:non-specific serine/threonine protein kinase [Theileria orientalis]